MWKSRLKKKKKKKPKTFGDNYSSREKTESDFPETVCSSVVIAEPSGLARSRHRHRTTDAEAERGGTSPKLLAKQQQRK